jgi:hypothetical protein
MADPDRSPFLPLHTSLMKLCFLSTVATNFIGLSCKSFRNTISKSICTVPYKKLSEKVVMNNELTNTNVTQAITVEQIGKP